MDRITGEHNTELNGQMASPNLNLDIWVVPFHGQGHLFPCIQLCHYFAARNYTTTLLISSDLSSSVPPSLRHHPKFRLAELPTSPPAHPHDQRHSHMAEAMEELLSRSAVPRCAVVDVMMSWTLPTFEKFQVPTVAFFTSGACSAALEFAFWKASPLDLKPGETSLLPGLPEDMGLTHSDLKRRPHGPPGRPGGPPPGFPQGPPDRPGGPPHGFPHGHPDRPGGPPPGFPHSQPLGALRPGFPPCPAPGAPWPNREGPPELGGQPPWLEEVKDSAALMFNTSDDLERPFLEYIADRIGKPVWGVGPLLPEQFWKSTDSLLRDREFRSNRPSSITEDDVIEWLDTKPRGSVLYVAFGSEVGPTAEEYPELADALEASNWPFIWVIQPGSGKSGPPQEKLENYPTIIDERFEERIGRRGLIIKGWAPQLLILSHPSTVAFLSHCGWNSTVEAIGRGIPILAWPIRGDQYWNAKLVANHLKVGCIVTDDLSQKIIRKDEIVKGIERLMEDEEVRWRASRFGEKFRHGFPESSVASIDLFFSVFIRSRAEGTVQRNEQRKC